MHNNLDKNFLQFYRFIKNAEKDNELNKFINYSFIKIYLYVKGREKYTPNKLSYLKRVLFSLKETFEAKKRLNSVLKNKSFNCIIIINESSHLKHAIPLKEDIKEFKPLFITNKKRYINAIAKSFKTDSIIYIPKTVIQTAKFKASEIEKSFSEFNIDASETGGIAEMLNDSYKNYSLTKSFIDTITAKNKIQFVYIFNDLLFTGRVIIDVCNSKGIKTYYLMHGLLSDEFIENLHICNNYLVFGDYTRDILAKKEGITAEKVIILGAPYLREQLKTKQVEFFEKEITNNLPKDKKIALVLLSGPGHTVGIEHHKAIINLLENVIADKKQEYHFVFKLHGKDSIEYYGNIRGNVDTKEFCEVYEFNHFQNRETIFDWIKMADIIITGASTTALEAMYMGKPVLTVDLRGEFDYEIDFIQQGATYHCKTKEEVYATLDNLLENNFSISPEAKEVVNQYFADFSNIQKFHKEGLPQKFVA